MGNEEFFNKLERDLDNLSGDKVLDVGKLPLEKANFLKETYEVVYRVDGPIKDKYNFGMYAVTFSLLNNLESSKDA